MKIKRIRVLVIILAMLLLLSSCSSKLDGTYTSQGSIAQSFIFNGDRVTMSAFGINASGTYTIKNDQITITYSLFGMEYVWSQPFSKSGKTINIGGTDFIKQE